MGNRGFTLLEVIIIVSVIIILFSISINSLNGWKNYFGIKSAVNKLYFNFLEVRQLALITHEDCGIYFDDKKNQYFLFKESGEIYKRVPLPDNIYFNEGDITFGGDRRVIFKPIGTAEGGHIIISTSGHQYSIIVYGHTGRIRYERVK